MANDDPDWAEAVLGFWFDELSRADWYRPSAATDAAVRARFMTLYEALSEAPPTIEVGSARAVLAAVIVLDQFPRNMFRGSARAFASDGTALALATAAVEGGADRELTDEQRHCLYLPFQHSEEPEVQARGCTLYAELDDAEGLDFALRHKAIIDRFGRFPHRNAILGRESTAEEREFLKQPGSSF
ncbi:MAG: DUF924 family protein [Alphaproteobacteria bacterium]|nr:DUF924 family protein [Alphaproteobacteria bacterium]